MKVEHFGLLVSSPKYGLYLTRNNYVMGSNKTTHGKDEEKFIAKKERYLELIDNEELRLQVQNDINKMKQINSKRDYNRETHIYNEAFIQSQTKDALTNFDINMSYYESLPRNEFNEALNTFLAVNKQFKEVTSIKDWENVHGHYMLILDNYKRCYIGMTNNIAKRIKEHWSKQMQLDRLINGSVQKSILSINSFRALDTTRIFAQSYEDYSSSETEFSLVESFDSRFVQNRTFGGIKSANVAGLLKKELFTN